MYAAQSQIIPHPPPTHPPPQKVIFCLKFSQKKLNTKGNISQNHIFVQWQVINFGRNFEFCQFINNAYAKLKNYLYAWIKSNI